MIVPAMRVKVSGFSSVVYNSARMAGADRGAQSAQPLGALTTPVLFLSLCRFTLCPRIFLGQPDSCDVAFSPCLCWTNSWCAKNGCVGELTHTTVCGAVCVLCSTLYLLWIFHSTSATKVSVMIDCASRVWLTLKIQLPREYCGCASLPLEFH